MKQRHIVMVAAVGALVTNLAIGAAAQTKTKPGAGPGRGTGSGGSARPAPGSTGLLGGLDRTRQTSGGNPVQQKPNTGTPGRGTGTGLSKPKTSG